MKQLLVLLSLTAIVLGAKLQAHYETALTQIRELNPAHPFNRELSGLLELEML
jgi:hypothetical protein